MLKLDNSMMKEVVLRERARKLKFPKPRGFGWLLLPFYAIYYLIFFWSFAFLSAFVIKPKYRSFSIVNSLLFVCDIILLILKTVLCLVFSFGCFLFFFTFFMVFVYLANPSEFGLPNDIGYFEVIEATGIPPFILIAAAFGYIITIILMIRNKKLANKKVPEFDSVLNTILLEKGKEGYKEFIKKVSAVVKAKTPTQFYKALNSEYKPYLEKVFAKEIAHMQSIQQKVQKLNEFGVNEDKFYKVFFGSNLSYIFTLIKALLFSKDTMPIFKETSRQVYITKGKKAQIKFILNAYKNSKKGNLEEVYTLLKTEKEYYKTIEDIAWSTEQFEERSRVILLGYALFDKMTAYKDAKKRVNNLYKVRDYKSLNELYAKYQPQVEEYKNNIIKTEGPKSFALEYDGKGTFDGYLIQKVGLSILCGIVNVVSLFIAYPATICWKQKWLCKHAVYDGKRLSFDGTGMQLFGKWLVWLLLSVVTLGIFLIFLPNKIEAWKAKHTHVNGEIQSLGGTFDGSVLGRFGLKMLCGIVNLFTLFICLPFTICWKQKWILKHTVYDGKRLSFNGNGLQLIGKWVLWCLLTLVTFGIYGLFVSIRMQKWKASHTHLSKDYEYVL